MATKKKLSLENTIKALKGTQPLIENTEPEKKDDEVEETVEEGTVAADSLKTHSSPDAKNDDPKSLTSSKVEMMKNMMNMAGSLDGANMVDFYNKVMNQFGHYADGAPNDSDKNKNSIDMKPSSAVGGGADRKDPMPKLAVKEDIDAMFEGQDISEEFKEKLGVVFEAAVGARIVLEKAALEEAFEEAYQSALEEQVSELVEKVDSYLDAVVTEWLEQNQIAVESALRTELTTEFIDNLKNLFNEHYISVPEDKMDVIESLAEKVEALEEQLDKVLVENGALKNALAEETKDDVVAEAAEGLTLSQQEKFAKLCEGIEFDGDLDLYASKITIIRENFFNSNIQPKAAPLNEEGEFGEDDSEPVKTIDPAVRRYVDAINRTVNS